MHTTHVRAQWVLGCGSGVLSHQLVQWGSAAVATVCRAVSGWPPTMVGCDATLSNGVGLRCVWRCVGLRVCGTVFKYISVCVGVISGAGLLIESSPGALFRGSRYSPSRHRGCGCCARVTRGYTFLSSSLDGTPSLTTSGAVVLPRLTAQVCPCAFVSCSAPRSLCLFDWSPFQSVLSTFSAF